MCAGQYIPVFLTECSPIGHRGLVASIAYMGAPVWCLLGASIGLPWLLGRPHLWQFVHLIPALPACP